MANVFVPKEKDGAYVIAWMYSGVMFLGTVKAVESNRPGDVTIHRPLKFGYAIGQGPQGQQAVQYGVEDMIPRPLLADSKEFEEVTLKEEHIFRVFEPSKDIIAMYVKSVSGIHLAPAGAVPPPG